MVRKNITFFCKSSDIHKKHELIYHRKNFKIMQDSSHILK